MTNLQTLNGISNKALLVVVLVFAIFVGFILYMKRAGTPTQLDHSGMSGQTNQDANQSNPGVPSDVSTARPVINMPVLNPPPKSTVNASGALMDRSVDNLINNPTDNSAAVYANSPEIDSAISKAESGGAITFHDPTFRMSLSDRVAKLGGQVGYYTTGAKALQGWTDVVNAGPNSSSSVPIAVPTASRPGGSSISDQNDAVKSMLANIANKGYVLQKAQPRNEGGYLVGAPVP